MQLLQYYKQFFGQMFYREYLSNENEMSNTTSVYCTFKVPSVSVTHMDAVKSDLQLRKKLHKEAVCVRVTYGCAHFLSEYRAL